MSLLRRGVKQHLSLSKRVSASAKQTRAERAAALKRRQNLEEKARQEIDEGGVKLRALRNSAKNIRTAYESLRGIAALERNLLRHAPSEFALEWKMMCKNSRKIIDDVISKQSVIQVPEKVGTFSTKGARIWNYSIQEGSFGKDHAVQSPSVQHFLSTTRTYKEVVDLWIRMGLIPKSNTKIVANQTSSDPVLVPSTKATTEYSENRLFQARLRQISRIPQEGDSKPRRAGMTLKNVSSSLRSNLIKLSKLSGNDFFTYRELIIARTQASTSKANNKKLTKGALKEKLTRISDQAIRRARLDKVDFARTEHISKTVRVFSAKTMETRETANLLRTANATSVKQAQKIELVVASTNRTEKQRELLRIQNATKEKRARMLISWNGTHGSSSPLYINTTDLLKQIGRQSADAVLAICHKQHPGYATSCEEAAKLLYGAANQKMISNGEEKSKGNTEKQNPTRPKDMQLGSSHGSITETDDLPPKGAVRERGPRRNNAPLAAVVAQNQQLQGAVDAANQRQEEKEEKREEEKPPKLLTHHRTVPEDFLWFSPPGEFGSCIHDCEVKQNWPKTFKLNRLQGRPFAMNALQNGDSKFVSELKVAGVVSSSAAIQLIAIRLFPGLSQVLHCVYDLCMERNVFEDQPLRLTDFYYGLMWQIMRILPFIANYFIRRNLLIRLLMTCLEIYLQARLNLKNKEIIIRTANLVLKPPIYAEKPITAWKLEVDPIEPKHVTEKDDARIYSHRTVAAQVVDQRAHYKLWRWDFNTYRECDEHCGHLECRFKRYFGRKTRMSVNKEPFKSFVCEGNFSHTLTIGNLGVHDFKDRKELNKVIELTLRRMGFDTNVNIAHDEMGIVTAKPYIVARILNTYARHQVPAGNCFPNDTVPSCGDTR